MPVKKPSKIAGVGSPGTKGLPQLAVRRDWMAEGPKATSLEVPNRT